MAGEAFILNRPVVELTDQAAAQDSLFAAQRLDGVQLQSKIFAHCTFANLSFKGCELRDCHFIDCVFVGCYFRKTLLDGCKFDGCKFIECDLPKVRIRGSSFVFPTFRGTFVPFDEMKPNLPREPELRAITSSELGREAQSSGHSRDARQYRIEALRAHEEHFWAGFRVATSWYEERYSTLDRIDALGKWIASQSNRLLWGNGERGVVLFRNFLLIAAIVFPVLFYIARSGLTTTGSLTLLDYLLLSADNVTGRSGFSGVLTVSTSTRILTGVEIAAGLVFFGLFVTLLFRRITRWRL